MMILNIAENELDILAVEFKSLQTINEKLKFWTNRLKVPYYFWSIYDSEHISRFIIVAEKTEEIEKINSFNIKQYQKDHDESENRIYDLEALKELFHREYDTIENKKEYIWLEIDKLIQRVKTYDGNCQLKGDNSNDFFERGYRDYYLNNKEPDLGFEIFEFRKLILLLNGFTLARYRKYLDDLTNQPAEKEDELTHEEQILILKFLGVANHIHDKGVKGEIYGLIIRRNSEKTRQKLSRIDTETTKKNLDTVYKYFVKYGFHEQAQAVNKEIDRRFKKR